MKCHLSSQYLKQDLLRDKIMFLGEWFPSICSQKPNGLVKESHVDNCDKLVHCLVPINPPCTPDVFKNVIPKIIEPPNPSSSKALQLRRKIKSCEDFEAIDYFECDDIPERTLDIKYYPAKIMPASILFSKKSNCDFTSEGLQQLTKVMHHIGMPKDLSVIYDWNLDPQNTALLSQLLPFDLSKDKSMTSLEMNVWSGSGIIIGFVLPTFAPHLSDLY